MKKNVVRILALILVGLMVLSLVPLISYADWCAHEHLTTVVAEPVCGEDGYTAAQCLDCGETFGYEIIPHTEEHDFSACVEDWDYLISEGSCLEPSLYYKSCSKCGMIAEFAYQQAMEQMQQSLWDQYNREVAYYGAPVSDWEARIRQATEDIQNTYTFKVGGDGHRFYEVEGQEATCTSDGWTPYRVCEVCGEIEGYETIPAKGHRFGEWAVTKEPTCTEDGVRERVCEVCGEKETEAVPATGHQGAFTTIKAPTCTEPGSEKRICTVCQTEEVREIPALGHKGPFVVTKEATCTEPGEQERICEVCGVKETAPVPAAHKYGEDNLCVFCGAENPIRSTVSDTETFGSGVDENADGANLENTPDAQPGEEQDEQLVEQYGGVEDTETFAVGEYTVTLSCAGGKYSAYEIALADTDTLTATCDKDTGNLIYYWIRETSDGVEQKIMKNGAVYEGKTYTPSSSSELNGTIRCAVKEIGSEKEAGRSDAWRVRAERTITLVTSGKGTMKYARERLGWETEKIDLELPENPTEYHSKDYTFLTGDSITLSMEPDTENHYLFRIIGILSGNVYQSKRTIADPNPYTFTVTSDQNYLLQSDLSNLYRETNPTTSADKDIKTSGIAQKALNDTLIPEIAGRYGVNPNAVKPSAIIYVTPIWYSDAIAMRDFEINAIGGFDFPLDYPDGIGENDVVLVFHFSGTSASGEWKQVSESQYTPGDKVNVKKYTDFSPFVVLGLENVTVTYKSGYDESTTITERKVKGTTFTVPACSFTAPTDKAFKNWLGSDGETYEVGATIPKTKLTGDFTLTAQWTAGHTITFDKNNANATGSMDKLFVLDGEERALTKNTFELKNHAFAGWSTTPDGEKVYDDEEKITPTENLDLYAKWNRTHSTITFDPNGGSGAMSSQTGELGGKITLAKNSFQNDGKLFSGWSTEKGGAVVYTDGQTINVPGSDQTVYAVWDYKVTVHYSPESDSGTGTGTMADQIVPGGRKFTLNANSFKAPDMTVFNGWNTVRDGSGTAYTDGQVISEGLTEDTNLYAQWKRTAYTVTYVGNGGTGSMSSQTIPLKGAVAISQNGFTAPYGKAFLGWSEDPDALEENPVYNPGQKLEASTLEARNADLTLYAVWGEIITVHFYPTDGQQTGTGTMADQQLIRGKADSLNANKFTAPADYKFTGWNTQPDGTGTPYADGKTFTKDELRTLPSTLNLYAQWERSAYNVSFDKNNENATGTMASQKIARTDMPAALNANTFKAPTDYKFKYWTKTAADPYADKFADEVTTDDVYKDKAEITVDTDTKLYAQWERSAYNVSFDKNNADASGTMASQKITRNVAATLNANKFTAPTGFAFKYWAETKDDPYPDTSANMVTATDVYRDKAEINGEGNRLTEDKILYAQWERVSYSVIYNANGGTGSMSAQTVMKDGAVSISENKFNAPAGKIFIGWSKTPGQENAVDYKVGATVKWEDLNKEPFTDLPVYAVWKDKITVHFDRESDSGTGSGTMADQEAPKGEKFTLNENKFTAPSGMAFKEWNTKKDGTGTVYTNAQKDVVFNEDTTLYAQWLEDACTVTFDKNDQEPPCETKSQSILKGVATKLEANSFETPAGKAFNGWNTKRDGSGTAFKDQATVKVSKDITLYAQWINAATITFNKNADAATGTMDNQVVETGVATPLNKNNFELENYRFKGWSTVPDPKSDPDAKGYADEGDIEIMDDIELHAQWEQVKYAITYDRNGGGLVDGKAMAKQSVTIGDEAIIANCAYKEPLGKVFAYWQEKPSEIPNNQAGENSDEHGDIYYPGERITPTHDLPLQAIWVDELTISYYPNDPDAPSSEQGGNGLYRTDKAPKGVKSDIKTPTELNYTPNAGVTFAYWRDKKNSKEYKLGEQGEFTENTQLYAIWAPACTITYNKNASDAKGTMANQTAPSGVEVTLHDNNFTRSEYIFKYWTKTKSDPYPNKRPEDVSSSDVYKDGTSITVTQDTNLYAQWYKTAITKDAVKITGDVTGLDDFAVWGEYLTAVVNDPVLKSGFTYTWLVDGNPAKSGEDNTYLVRQEDYGKTIVCVVSHPQATNEVESNPKIVGTYAESDDLIIINNGNDSYPYSKYAYVYGVVPGTTFYKDGKAYLVPEAAKDGYMEIGIPGTYTFGHATYYIENWYTVGYEVDSTGGGTVTMKNGSTTLTSSTKTSDIQHFTGTIWLVRDGSATDLNITMKPASSTYVHWAINGGSYSSSGTEVSRRLGTINQPMLFSIVFNKSSSSPKTGDMSQLGMWSALCFSSLVGAAGLIGSSKKRRKNGK